MDTSPPAGSATSGSTAKPQTGLRARSSTTTSGPAAAAARHGPPPGDWSSAASPAGAARPRSRRAIHEESSAATASAQSAGAMFLAISDVSSTWNASAAAMVFGLGETTLPAFPPPTIATSSAETGSPALRPTASATGATVMTAMSTKTPTDVTIIVASAIAASANLAPIARMIASASFSALPVFTSAPARMPEVSMRSTLGIIDCAPDIIALTVSGSPPPPISPPASAPATSAYAGAVLRIIRTIAIASPVNAPQVENI